MGRSARGRPLASSQEALQDAAFELFLENTYAKTTIEQITQRAGVSRATFFNYFAAKSDVFWVDLDHALEVLQRTLLDSGSRGARDHRAGLEKVQQALVVAGDELGTDRMPFALTQHELIGSVHELQASALTRLSYQTRVIAQFLEDYGLQAPIARAVAYACIAAAISGAQEWAVAGTSREPFKNYLYSAIEPVIAGFIASEP